MKTINIKIQYFVIFAILLISAPGLFAQTKATIANVDFYAESNKIIITYDIVDYQPGETFNIWIQVKSTGGKIVNAKTTTGDIGKGIAGGPGKRIEWDYIADQFNIADEVSIEVFAALEGAAKKTETKQAETKETKPAAPPPATTQGYRKISVGTAMVLSAILPGLGKTYIKGHGANWMLGVLGYGLITVSVLENHAAYDNLEDYRASTDPDERDKLYNKAVGQAAISYVCIGGAITIWVVDLITTGVKAGKARKNPEPRVQINGNFDMQARVPVIGLSYRF